MLIMTAQIYVACLAAYSNGKLHGEWIPCTDEDTIKDGIKKVLETSPENNKPYPCEEFAIHDHEGLGDIGEYTPISDIVARVEFIEEVGDEDLALAILEHACDLDEAKTLFENYNGEYKNIGDFAYGLMEDCYDLNAIPDVMRHHIDFDGVARDLFINDYTDINSKNGIYVFTNN